MVEITRQNGMQVLRKMWNDGASLDEIGAVEQQLRDIIRPLPNGMKRPPKRANPAPPACIHRGAAAELVQVDCATCGGRTEKIEHRAYECKLHGKCVPYFCGEVLGYAVCQRCSDEQLPPDAPPGLGDRIESALTAIGITKDRWKSFKEACGLPPTCNCDQRQQKINDAEAWMKAAVEHLGESAKSAIESVWKPLVPRQRKPPQSGM